MEQDKWPNDFQLWKAFKEGDKSALDIIFKRHYSGLYDYGIKITQEEHLVVDTLQDFFLYIYEHRQQLKDIDCIPPYLFKSFRNRILKDLQKSRRIISFKAIENDPRFIQFSIEEVLIQQENTQLQQTKVHQLLNQLSNRQKELIYLRYFQNLSILEIAEVISISYQGVLNGLSKSLKKLRLSVKISSSSSLK